LAGQGPKLCARAVSLFILYIRYILTKLTDYAMQAVVISKIFNKGALGATMPIFSMMQI